MHAPPPFSPYLGCLVSLDTGEELPSPALLDGQRFPLSTVQDPKNSLSAKGSYGPFNYPTGSA